MGRKSLNQFRQAEIIKAFYKVAKKEEHGKRIHYQGGGSVGC